MNRKNTKRLLSVILSLVMVLSYLPATSFAFAENSDAEPGVEAELNDGGENTGGSENTGGNDTVVDSDTNTSGDSDQVKEDDKEDPPAVEEKKDEQAEPVEEGKQTEAKTEEKEPAKDLAKGPEDEEGEGEEEDPPASGNENENVKKDILYFINHGLGWLTLVHADGSSITEDNPAEPGEVVELAFHISEEQNGAQFDMVDMFLEIPAGLEVPEEDDVYAPPDEGSITEIEDVDGQIYDLPNTYIIGSDGKIKYIWKNPHTEERNGKTVDVYALAKRAEDMEYGISLKMTIGKDADSIVFSDTISFPVDRSVALTVTKDISIPGMTSITPEQGAEMVFGLFDADGNPVKNDEGEDITFNYNDMNKTAGPLHGTYKINGLMPITVDDNGDPVFIVKEIGHPDIAGYTFIEPGADPNVVTEITVTIPLDVHSGQSATAPLKNSYTKDVGNLKIKKSFPEGSELNADNLTPTQKQKIKFTVYKVVNGTRTFVEDATLADFEQGYWNIQNLPIGTYEVEETDEISGYSRTTTYTVKTADVTTTTGNGVTAPVTVEKDGNYEVEFANTYIEQKGELELTKTFDDGGQLTDAEKNRITFTVTRSDGTKIGDYPYSEFENGVLTIPNLRVGTYKVEEKNVNIAGYHVTSTYTVNGSTKNGTVANNVNVDLGETSTVDFVNKYTAVGSIKLTKAVGGNYWGDYGNTYNNQQKRRNAIKEGVTYKLYKIGEGGEREEVQTIPLTAFIGSNDEIGTYTIPNLPLGTYEIDEIVSGEVTNTIRTTTVTNNGTTTTANPDATPVSSGNVSVEKGVTKQVDYVNNYDKKKGRIYLDKTVVIDGEEVALSDLDDDQLRAIEFTISGKTVYNNKSYSKTVTLYDVFYHENGIAVDENGNAYLEVEYGTYTVKESKGDLPNYIRVTTAKLDNGEFTATDNVSAQIDKDHTERSVTFKNDYSASGRLKIIKEVRGLSSTEAAAVRAQIRFKIEDTSNPPRPIVRGANGKLKLGNAGDTPAEFTVAEMEQGIDIPTGTYVITELKWEYNDDYYDCSVYNMLVVGQDTIFERYNPVSGNTEITQDNEKDVLYRNTYSRVGVGNGVTVNKTVWLDGVPIGADSDARLRQFDALVKGKIRFELYEGSSATGSPVATYTYAELQGNPLTLDAGVWTIKETNYGIDHYDHAIRFTVSGTSQYSDNNDTVTFTLIRNSAISIDVINAYIPLGNLEVVKLFGNDSDLNADNLTVAQKKAIKFTVKGYKNTSFEDVIFPEETFSYNDMTLNEDGVMSKLFENIPTGVYVVTEEADVFANYNFTSSSDPTGNAITVPFYDSEDPSIPTKTFTNTYKRKKGELQITKVIEGEFDGDENLDDITFTVKSADGAYTRTIHYNEMSNGYISIPDLDTGDYIIKESHADFPFQERTTTVTVNGVEKTYSETNGVTVTVEEGKDGVVTAFNIKNSYKTVGALIINKSFVNGDALTPAQKNNIRFTVKDSNGDVIKTITYLQIQEYIEKYPDYEGYRLKVDPGTYIIEESNANFAGYNRVTTATVDGESVSVTEDDEHQTAAVSTEVTLYNEQSVVFTNEYDEIGSLTIKKAIEGYNNLKEKEKEAIKFTVEGKDSSGSVIYHREFTFADMVDGKITLSNLPAGIYTVQEEIIYSDGDDTFFYGGTFEPHVKVGTGAETDGTVANNVTVSKDGQTVAFRNVYKDDDKLIVEKQIGGAPLLYIDKGDSKYPVWKFNLKIDKLGPSTTAGGETYLTDIYDNDYKKLFEIVTDDGDLAAIENAAKEDTEDKHASTIANKLHLPTGVEGVTADVETIPDYEHGEVKFRIYNITDSTAKDNNYLTYYLIPKSKEALETLNTRDDSVPENTPSNMLLKNFSNTVKYKALPGYEEEETTTISYEYQKTVVLKKCLNYDVDTNHLTDGHGHQVDYALYHFIINPEEMKLSTEGYIEVEDEFSPNQSVDLDSITVERCVYNLEDDTYTTSPALDDDVTFKDLQGNKIKLTVKDETCFRVTYKSYVLYNSEEAYSLMKLDNKVTVAGYSKGIEPEIIPHSSGSGTVYQIKLKKYQNGNLDNTLRGAKFQMYLSLEDAQADWEAHENDPSVGYPNSIGEYETDENGVVTIESYEHNGETHYITANADHPIVYSFIESEPPEGYEPIDYIVQVQLAGKGQIPQYGPDVWIYRPTDTVGIKNSPFETMIALGALKTFETNESDRELGEGDFTFQIRAKDNANIPMPEQTEVPNDADGKAVFGAIGYDTEDVITRDPDTKKVTGTSKTFEYEVSEVLPDGVTSQNPTKDGITYDTHVYEVAVTVKIVDGELKVTSVTVDGDPVTADSDKYVYHDTSTDPETVTDVDLYFVGLENEYTAEGTWTPVIQKDLQGRPLEEGEFTFQIIDKDDQNKVLATGTNNADGSVTMDPETLTFTLADLGANHLQVKEVYTLQTDDGIYSVAEDVDVTVTVSEKQNKDGTLNVVANPEGSLTAPIVMTNKYHASGSWHPKALKKIDGPLKINKGDYSFELAAVGNEPMPVGSTNGKKVVDCEADGTVDFGQIDFYQGNFNNKDYEDGGKEFHYTIQEVIPEPEDRIFGVKYDDTVYEITVTTKINKTDKLGVKVECKPKTGWVVDESTATFTGTFTNTYDVKPVKIQPEYEKTINDGEVPSENMTFKFVLDKADEDPGNFDDYVRVKGEDGELVPFTSQEKELVLGPDTQEDSGLFDEITFLAIGTYKFKITETPETKEGLLDGNIEFDKREYTYTVVVTGSDGELSAKGTYSYKENGSTQTAKKARFSNKYTPNPVNGKVPVKKMVPGEPLVRDKTFKFILTPDPDNKESGVFIGNTAFEGEDAEDTVSITVPAGATYATGEFKELTFKKQGTYKFTVKEIVPEDDNKLPGITYDDVPEVTVTFVIVDNAPNLEVKSRTFKKGDTEPSVALFSNPYCPKPVDYTPQVEKTVVGHPTVEKKTFHFTLKPNLDDLEEGEEPNKEGGVFLKDGEDYVAFEGEDAEDKTTVVVPAGEKTATADFSKLQFRKEGVYHFIVTELVESEPGITYDEVLVGYLTVTVKDEDGWLSQTHVYKKAEVTDEQYAKFENDYTPEPVVEILRGVKVIEGDPQEDEEFTFKLASGGNNAQLPDGSYIPNPMPEEDEVTITGEGEFEFGDMTYEWPGEYYYKISEAAGDAMAFEYDTAVWSVKVTVTDKDGYLEAETTYVSDLDEETIEELATFTNIYSTNELKITKTVKGKAGDKKKFKFTISLFNEDGEPLEGEYPITGDGEGKVVNGVGTVYLAHGEEAYVTDIPIDATWIVEEEDYANYTAKCDKDHGTITVDKASESNWINSTGVDTGDHNNVGGYLGLFGTSLMALAAMIFGRRRRRVNGK